MSESSKLLSYVGTTPVPSLTLPVDQLGPAGIKGEIHVLAQLPNEERSDAARLQDISLRQFKISALLSKLPPAVGDISGSFSEKDGSSYFLAPAATVLHKVDTQDGSFRILKNGADELALIDFECMAIDIAGARQKFSRVVIPFLDYMSYLANVPVFLSTTKVEDPKNVRTSIGYVSPFRKTTINTHTGRVFKEMSPVYSMYREAKNTHSDFYRFLCYYKILEGLLGKMRANAYKRASDKGVQIRAPRRLVPDCSELPDALRIYVGKPIKAFFDDVLTPKFRNAIAHFMTDGGSILNMSDSTHLDDFANIMLICELSVRAVIADHEALLSQLES